MTANSCVAGIVMTYRPTSCGGAEDLLRFHAARLAIRAMSSKAPTPAIMPSLADGRIPFAAAVVADAACEPPSAIHFNSSQTSLAACQRFSGSLARHFFTTRSRAGGVMGWSDAIDGGSDSRILAITLAEVFPSNAFLPVAIS